MYICIYKIHTKMYIYMCICVTYACMLVFFLALLYYLFFERGRGRVDGERERENIKQAPCAVLSPRSGLVS